VEAPGSGARADELAADYAARHIAAERAFELGLIDAVIRPGETRGRLTIALHGMLAGSGASRVRTASTTDPPVLERDAGPVR
jgi:acetyl-CoA carboxylase carboxyltransferase component